MPRPDGDAEREALAVVDRPPRAEPALSMPTPLADADDEDRALRAARRLQALVDRARRQPDLPLLAGTRRLIEGRARGAGVHLQSLADAAHGDPALVWRLLRRANGALMQASGGAVGDVPRALAVLGAETLARAASAGPRLDPDDAGPQARLQGESCLRALIGAELTDALCDAPQLAARAPAVGMAPHLGRMVLATHDPQAALTLRAARLAHDDAATEDAAVRRHFGCGHDGIAQALGRAWGLPDSLRPVPAPAPDDWPLRRSEDAQERLRWLARMAHEASDLMLRCALPQPAGPFGAERERPVSPASGLEQLGLRAARVLGLDPRRLVDDLQARHERLPALLERAGLPADLLRVPVHEAVPAPLALLLHGLWRHLMPRRAVLLLSPHPGRQHQPHQVVAQYGLPLSAAQRAAWRVDPWHGRDLYARLCAVGRLSLVADVMAPNLQRHLPPAFARQPPGRHFLLLPLHRGGRPIGMVYLDRDERQPFELDEVRQRQIIDAVEATMATLKGH